MRIFRILAGLLVIALFSVIPLIAQKRLTAEEAKAHIGETATVCGTVVSTHYATRTKGSPTFLNLDEPYPNQVFTILIWGSERPTFGDPEARYGRKKVCVTGLIKDYRGVPEMIVKQPSQIEIVN